MFLTLTIVLIVVDVPLFAFHLSMTVFLVIQIVKNVGQFRQGFFVLHVTVSVADCCYIVHVSRSSSPQHRYANFLVQAWALVRLPAHLHFTEFYSDCYWCPKIAYEWSGYFSDLQCLCHIVIACNRFTVFFAPRIHQRIWKGTPLKVVVVALPLVSLAMISYMLPVPLTYSLDSGEIFNEGYEDPSIRKVSVDAGQTKLEDERSDSSHRRRVAVHRRFTAVRCSES